MNPTESLESLSPVTAYQNAIQYKDSFVAHLFSGILQDHKNLGYMSGLIYYT